MSTVLAELPCVVNRRVAMWAERTTIDQVLIVLTLRPFQHLTLPEEGQEPLGSEGVPIQRRQLPGGPRLLEIQRHRAQRVHPGTPEEQAERLCVGQRAHQPL